MTEATPTNPVGARLEELLGTARGFLSSDAPKSELSEVMRDTIRVIADGAGAALSTDDKIRAGEVLVECASQLPKVCAGPAFEAIEAHLLAVPPEQAAAAAEGEGAGEAQSGRFREVDTVFCGIERCDAMARVLGLQSRQKRSREEETAVAKPEGEPNGADDAGAEAPVAAAEVEGKEEPAGAAAAAAAEKGGETAPTAAAEAPEEPKDDTEADWETPEAQVARQWAQITLRLLQIIRSDSRASGRNVAHERRCFSSTLLRLLARWPRMVAGVIIQRLGADAAACAELLSGAGAGAGEEEGAAAATAAASIGEEKLLEALPALRAIKNLFVQRTFRSAERVLRVMTEAVEANAAAIPELVRKEAVRLAEGAFARAQGVAGVAGTFTVPAPEVIPEALRERGQQLAVADVSTPAAAQEVVKSLSALLRDLDRPGRRGHAAREENTAVFFNVVIPVLTRICEEYGGLTKRGRLADVVGKEAAADVEAVPVAAAADAASNVAAVEAAAGAVEEGAGGEGVQARAITRAALDVLHIAAALVGSTTRPAMTKLVELMAPIRAAIGFELFAPAAFEAAVASGQTRHIVIGEIEQWLAVYVRIQVMNIASETGELTVTVKNLIAHLDAEVDAIDDGLPLDSVTEVRVRATLQCAKAARELLGRFERHWQMSKRSGASGAAAPAAAAAAGGGDVRQPQQPTGAAGAGRRGPPGGRRGGPRRNDELPWKRDRR